MSSAYRCGAPPSTPFRRLRTGVVSVLARDRATVIFHRDVFVALLLLLQTAPLVAPFLVWALGASRGIAATALGIVLTLLVTGDVILVSAARVRVFSVLAGFPWRRVRFVGPVDVAPGDLWDDLYGQGEELLIRSGASAVVLTPMHGDAEILHGELDAALQRRCD